jgi:hypothetical protein
VNGEQWVSAARLELRLFRNHIMDDGNHVDIGTSETSYDEGGA